MKYIVYIRVSTEQQGEHGLGSEAQLHACQEWIKKNHKQTATADIRIFKDVVTGTDRDLKALDQRPKMLEAITTASKDDVFLVYKRDRIARNSFVVGLIERDLKKMGAVLKCANGEGEGDEPQDVLMRLILDAFAEYEGLVIAKRIKVAMDRKKAKGERMGHIPYGYMLDSNKNLVINPNEAKTLEEMWNYRVVHKKTFREIASKLNHAGYRNRPNKNTSGDPWTYGSIARVYKNYPMLTS